MGLSIGGIINKAVDLVQNAAKAATEAATKLAQPQPPPAPPEQSQNAQQWYGKSSFETNDLVYHPGTEPVTGTPIGTKNSTTGGGDSGNGQFI